MKRQLVFPAPPLSSTTLIPLTASSLFLYLLLTPFLPSFLSFHQFSSLELDEAEAFTISEQIWKTANSWKYYELVPYIKRPTLHNFTPNDPPYFLYP